MIIKPIYFYNLRTYWNKKKNIIELTTLSPYVIIAFFKLHFVIFYTKNGKLSDYRGGGHSFLYTVDKSVIFHR